MIDLVSVNYNTPRELTRQVETLNSDNDGRSWTYYLADNNAPEDNLSHGLIRSWVESDKYQIDGVSLNSNIGYARACNMGANRGGSQIIGFLNADVWLTTADVKKIEKIFDEDPRVTILGPKQRDEQNRIRHAGILGTNTNPKMRGWSQPDPQNTSYRDRVECVTVSGSAYFIRREAWELLTSCPTYVEACKTLIDEKPEGAFLPTPGYWEETFCSYHARAHGYRAWYDGEVSIGHTWHASTPIGQGHDEPASINKSRGLFKAACEAHNIPHDQA